MPIYPVLRRFLPLLSLLAVVTSSPPAIADLRLLLAGQAHDVTTAEDAAITLELTLVEDGPSMAAGRFDGEHLSGAFTATGGPTKPCKRGHVCLRFTGALSAAYAVTTPLTLAVELKPGLQHAEGIYRLAPHDPQQPDRWGRFSVQSLAE